MIPDSIYVLYTSATNKVVDTRSISSLFIDWYGEDNSWQQEFLLYSNVCLRDHKGITGPLGCDMLSHVELCLYISQQCTQMNDTIVDIKAKFSSHYCMFVLYDEF